MLQSMATYRLVRTPVVVSVGYLIASQAAQAHLHWALDFFAKDGGTPKALSIAFKGGSVMGISVAALVYMIIGL